MSNKKPQISDQSYIAPWTKVADWKRHYRLPLIKGLLANAANAKEWEVAFDIFRRRVDARFLNPIDWILRHEEADRGAGFSAVALQCVLIEFLEGFYQGKIYTTSVQPRDFEYHSSKGLFRDFLRNHKPFKDRFTNDARANGFYDNIRCGLLHEAQTKGTSVIRHDLGHGFFVVFDDEMPGLNSKDDSNMAIYRERFQEGLREYLDRYQEELMHSPVLQRNFIRKMDDLAGIKHRYYFAYGSNMLEERLFERLQKYHFGRKARLNNYRVVFNKISSDGTAKANLEKAEGEFVLGVCYEIDADDFQVLDKIERGYQRLQEQDCILNIIEDNIEVRAVTYVSNKTALNIQPSSEYIEMMIRAARSWRLDEDYVSSNLMRLASE